VTDDPGTGAAADDAKDRYYRGVISRVYYGSETGTLVSDATGREYRFKFPYVEILGTDPAHRRPAPGMAVGFDLGWTSHGIRVTVIRVY